MKAKTCSEPELFKALGDRTRYKIVLSLMNRELCACNLPKIVNRAQSTVSLQLKYLSNLGILSSRREGKKIIYSVADRRVYELFKALGHTQFLCSKKKWSCFKMR